MIFLQTISKMGESIMYPDLNDQQQRLLNKIDDIEDCFIVLKKEN